MGGEKHPARRWTRRGGLVRPKSRPLERKPRTPCWPCGRTWRLAGTRASYATVAGGWDGGRVARRRWVRRYADRTACAASSVVGRAGRRMGRRAASLEAVVGGWDGVCDLRRCCRRWWAGATACGATRRRGGELEGCAAQGVGVRGGGRVRRRAGRLDAVAASWRRSAVYGVVGLGGGRMGGRAWRPASLEAVVGG
jgi:hypothetical protein